MPKARNAKGRLIPTGDPEIERRIVDAYNAEDRIDPKWKQRITDLGVSEAMLAAPMKTITSVRLSRLAMQMVRKATKDAGLSRAVYIRQLIAKDLEARYNIPWETFMHMDIDIKT